MSMVYTIRNWTCLRILQSSSFLDLPGICIGDILPRGGVAPSVTLHGGLLEGVAVALLQALNSHEETLKSGLAKSHYKLGACET